MTKISETLDRYRREAEKANRAFNTLSAVADKIKRDIHVHVIDGATPRLYCICDGLADVAHLLRVFKPKGMTQEVATSTGTKIVNSPYTVTIGHYINSTPTMSIRWDVDGYILDAEFKADLLPAFVHSYERRVDRCEHHYFIGVPARALENMRTMTRTFKTGKVLQYNNGQSKQYDENVINSIIKLVLKS